MVHLSHEMVSLYHRNHHFESYSDNQFPTINDLKAQKAKLEKGQNCLKKQQQSAYNRMKELRIVDTNVTTLLAPHTLEMKFGNR